MAVVAKEQESAVVAAADTRCSLPEGEVTLDLPTVVSLFLEQPLLAAIIVVTTATTTALM